MDSLVLYKVKMMKLKNVIVFIFVMTVFMACESGKYKVDKYLTKEESTLLKKELSRYMDKLPERVSMEERWSAKANSYYTLKADSMNLLRYYEGTDGYNYYYITRIVPSIRAGERRASAGRFQWETKDRIKNLEEFFLSNILPEETLNKAADDLFQEAVEKHKVEEKGSVELIEWPNDYFAYNKESHSWDRRVFIQDTIR